jgi:hypothetical protein
VESIEAEVPIVMRRYHLMPDTGGAGEHRGGLAVRLDFQVFHPHAIVTARGMERFRLEPWGVAGGRAGTAGSCVVNRDTPRARDIGKVDVLHLEPGDVVSIFSPSGGGPATRAGGPRAVRDDVRAGCLGRAGPRRTAWRRGRRVTRRQPPGGGDHGAARRRRLTGAGAPRWSAAGRRHPGRRRRSWTGCRRRARSGKHQIYDRSRRSRRAPATPADVDTVWADIRARLRALGD